MISLWMGLYRPHLFSLWQKGGHIMKKNRNQHRVQDILKLIRTERDPYFLERALDSYHDHDIADVLPLLSSPEWKRLASLFAGSLSCRFDGICR